MSEKIIIEKGRIVATRDGDVIRLQGEVTGGGAHGPGSVYLCTGLNGANKIRPSSDSRSRSGRSGYVTWTLEPDALYWLRDFAQNSSSSFRMVWLSTASGSIEFLDIDEARKILRVMYPAEAALCDDLPDLSGTERQVEWATSARGALFAYMFAALERDTDREAILQIAAQETSAGWWLDHRNNQVAVVAEFRRRLAISRETPEQRDARLAEIAAQEAEEAAKREGYERLQAEREAARLEKEAAVTVRPATERIPEIAYVLVYEASTKVSLDVRDEQARLALKAIGYSWDKDARCWSRPRGATTAVNAAAVTIAALVRVGIVTVCQNDEARAIAIAGSFLPLTTKVLSADGKSFLLRWARGDGDHLYGEARKIYRSAWDKAKQAVVIPGARVDEVLDFAAAHGFAIEASAQVLADTINEKRGRGVVVAETAPLVSNPTPAGTKPAPVSGVHPALLDD